MVTEAAAEVVGVSTVILDHSNSEVMTCPFAQATQEAFPEVGVFSESLC
jgi:hypothetical protein